LEFVGEVAKFAIDALRNNRLVGEETETVRPALEFSRSSVYGYLDD
jgi:hypothetical protein